MVIIMNRYLVNSIMVMHLPVKEAYVGSSPTSPANKGFAGSTARAVCISILTR